MSRLAVVGGGRLRPGTVAGWAASATTVLVVYVVVVLGGGALLGRTDSPSLGLSILATALVAAVAPRVQARVARERSRRRGGDPPSPYDVLADFSRATGSDAGEQAPSVIARMLVQSLGLAWAQVWVLVGGELRLVAQQPDRQPDRQPDVGPPPRLYESGTEDGVRTVTVAHGGRVLGVLRVKEPDDHPLSPTADRLLGGLAAQAGLVLESAQLREELAVQLQELTVREADLRRARGQLVAAQDLERRRLERDLHDGAQQQLVALAINLKLADVLAATSPAAARDVLEAQLAATDDAIRTLSDLTGGLVPPTLERAGLVAALVGATATNPVPVRVRGEVPRLSDDVEATLYFVALEAVQNATKHAGSTRIDLRLHADAAGVSLAVDDDGSGIASDVREGRGLANLRERAAGLGGRLDLVGRPGGGTTVAVHVPRPIASTDGP